MPDWPRRAQEVTVRRPSGLELAHDRDPRRPGPQTGERGPVLAVPCRRVRAELRYAAVAGVLR